MGLPKADLGKALASLTTDKGAAIVKSGDRTFVVVEVEPQPLRPSAEPYRVTDREEAADLKDALDDRDNPTFAAEDALQYLRKKRASRGQD